MVDKSDSALGKPIPFISIDQRSGAFSVASEAMEFLESLPRNVKISVVAIAGPYRTGKSFLANRILNQNSGFEIGSTTQACTKGIWMWNKPVQIAPDQIMLLLDTEGLASTERSTNVDIKIFTLSILLSSLFVFNQMGPITENSLEDLSLVANLTNYIHISSSSSKDGYQDYKSFFPQFFWVLRDFYHTLEGQTPKQYLEECLLPSPGISQDTLKKNGIREAISKYFKERECFTMIRPVADESKLAHVDSLKFEELKTEFRKEVGNFVKEIKRRIKPKVINGKVLNSSMFLQLALEYTEAINNKETPTVLTAIDRVVQAEANKIQDSIYDTFNLQLDTLIHEDNVPMTKQLFGRLVRQTIKRNKLSLHKQLCQILNFSEIIKESEKFIQRVQDTILTKLKQNYSASYQLSGGILSKFYATMGAMATRNGQMDAQAIHDYIRKWVSLCKDYKDQAKSINQWEVFSDSLVKQQNLQSLFVSPDLVDLDQNLPMSDLGSETDEISTAYSTAKSLKELDFYAFDLLLCSIEQVIDSMNDQLHKLKVTLNETQLHEKKLSHKKKQNDQMIDMQRQQNEDLADNKHDLEMKIETLRRDIQSRTEELDSLKQVKDLEIKGLKKNFDMQLKERDEDIKQLEQLRTQNDQVSQSTSSKAQDLDSEKRKEVSSVQNEIKKLEEDVEGLKNKMKNKENNPHFIQVNQFFAEVKDYIEEFKKLCSDQEASKLHKKRLFTLQKQLNDIEYQASQTELQLKKQLDDQLRLQRDQLDKNLDLVQQELDHGKVTLQMQGDKAQLYQQQVDTLGTQIQEAQERAKTLQVQKETAYRQVEVKQVKVEQMRKELEEIDENQRNIEEQIYLLSIENKQKEEDKEIMLMLLPHIVKAINGKANNIKTFVNQFENDATRAKVMKMFQTYKIPFK